MNGVLFLLPIALLLGALGLAAFFWALRNNQFDDPDGAAARILIDACPKLLEVVDAKGVTPLMAAGLSGHNNTVLVLTSNIGSGSITGGMKPMGFAPQAKSEEEAEEQAALPPPHPLAPPLAPLRHLPPPAQVRIVPAKPVTPQCGARHRPAPESTLPDSHAGSRAWRQGLALARARGGPPLRQRGPRRYGPRRRRAWLPAAASPAGCAGPCARRH